jgi:hypothetical protein
MVLKNGVFLVLKTEKCFKIAVIGLLPLTGSHSIKTLVLLFHNRWQAFVHGLSLILMIRVQVFGHNFLLNWFSRVNFTRSLYYWR